EAVFAQVPAMRLEMLDQRSTPRIAARRIAERVERQRHALGDTQLLEQLIREYQQFGIGERAVAAEHLRIQLMELAIATLLRPLVAEQWAVRRDLERRELLPA